MARNAVEDWDAARRRLRGTLERLRTDMDEQPEPTEEEVRRWAARLRTCSEDLIQWAPRSARARRPAPFG